ncbi:MAG: argininosuccinate lyase [Bacteroidales bacterium]
MKLWTKGTEPHKIVEQFTVGNDRQLDLKLAKHDVNASIAHIKMLASIGLLSSAELETLLAGLMQIAEEIEIGDFAIPQNVEDIHSQVEFLLTERLGEVGKKIHAGRSRNDQVLVDLKLFFREETQHIATHTQVLFERLQKLSEQHKAILMPGYTHLQIAMPSSFGLWFGAYAEALSDDVHLLAAAYNIINQNPLGSAAGYGSSFPLNRQMTTELLHFEELHYNVITAQMSRGKTERALSAAIASLASTLARLAMDMCLFMSQNFAFISFPDQLTTGSSIMPHKKNPDVWELIRGKCNRLQSLPNEVALLCCNLPIGYHRDMQLLKEIMFPAIEEIGSCLKMTEFMLQHIQVNKNILEDEKYNYLFTVEDVNRQVLEGVPFREAYKQVGQQVNHGDYKPNKQIKHSHQGSIGNLCTEEIAQKMKKNIFVMLKVIR